MFCGLDFGTSNSAIGLENDGLFRLCPLETRNLTMPSAVFYKSENNSAVFGTQAINEFLAGTQGRLIKAMKNLLGTPLLNEKTIIGVDLSTRTPIEVDYSQIIADYIVQLKSKAESQLELPLDSVLIGRPVRFHDYFDHLDLKAEHALLKIARDCGFINVEFQLEPVAASLLYQNQASKTDEIVFVADIGGGTSDFSVVKLNSKKRNFNHDSAWVLANGGIHLGGTDFDASLSLHSVMPHFGLRSLLRFDDIRVPTQLYHLLVRWHSIIECYKKSNIDELRSLKGWYREPQLYDRLVSLVTEKRGHEILDMVEKCKIHLTNNPKHHFKFTLRNESLAFDIQCEELNQALAENINRIIAAANDTLLSSGAGNNHIDRIVFTGGSSLVPLVKSRIKKLIPNAKVSDDNVFDAVGLGLAIDAKNKFR